MSEDNKSTPPKLRPPQASPSTKPASINSSGVSKPPASVSGTEGSKPPTNASGAVTPKPAAAINSLGYTRADYKGLPSTLCTGCGHDSITNQIIGALYQSDISPYDIVKLSGIGCSSKTPAYFLNQAHGFNSIHGRMAPVSLGVHLAKSQLKLIGVSGDGDTASIGLGGFVHMIRRNIPIVYIIANNGVYGLTKGQFSATADINHKTKTGEANAFSSIDTCRMALDLGCGFVARGFSGDMKQMVALLSAALRYNGTAVIDVISPCVTFANHDGSTKSYDYAKEHLSAYQEVEFLPHSEIQKVDYPEGEIKEIMWPDGSQLLLKKATSDLSQFNDPDASIKALREAENAGQILTGLFMCKQNLEPLQKRKNYVDDLSLLSDEDVRIPKDRFKSFISQFS